MCFRVNRRPGWAIVLVCCLLSPQLFAGRTSGLLFEFGKIDGPVNYLFGTMHTSDPRVDSLLDKLQSPLASSELLVMEMVPDLVSMAASASGMFLPGERKLKDLTGDELYREVRLAAEKKGVPDQLLQRFRPWAAAVTISLPELTGDFMDQSIYKRALELRKPVYGLESAAEQLAVFDQMDESLQVQLLRDTVEQLEQLPTQYEAVVNAYLSRDLTMLKELSREYETVSDEEFRDWFELVLIQNRNLRMAERLKEYLSQGRVFVAVGALHLPGEQGLLNLLKAEGYRVTPVE